MFKRNAAALIGYVTLVVLLTAGMAQSLSGSNTVLSDDIKNGQVHGEDINTNAVSSSKVKDNSLTGADIKESTLAIPQGVTGYEVVHTQIFEIAKNGGVAFSVGCPAGKVPVGGGIDSNPASRSILAESYPSPYDHTRWYLAAYNRDINFAVSVTGYAACVTTQ